MGDMTSRRDQAKARTRAAIIDAGIRLMHDRGYAATSTTAIARAAGVAPATLFNYFPTKAAIVVADDHLWAPVAPSAPRTDPSTDQTTEPYADPRATLRHLIEGLLDRPEWTRGVDDPLTALRFALVRREPALAAAQNQRILDLAPGFAGLLREAHPDLAPADALALAGAACGAIAVTLAHGPAPDLRQAICRATDLALGRPPGRA